MSVSRFNWLYPALIAHRGAGKHAPENTLSAMREGAAQGYKMFEYDAKLSQDGVAILLHDDSVDRTSNGSGLASQLSLAELLNLDFGAWHGPKYAGEPLLTLSGMANFCIPRNLHSNIEIKPNLGLEAQTGAAIAHSAAMLWANTPQQPLLSSFSITALRAAKLAAPHLPLAWLIDEELDTNWLDTARDLQVVALNLNDKHVSADHIQQVKSEGYSVCVWTANDPTRVQQLLRWGCNSVITDAIYDIAPDINRPAI